MNSIYFFELFGTLVFAISGMLAAIEEKMDFVGVIILGFVTALGGGTLRDLLMGNTPVGWMQDNNFLYLVLLAIPICFLARKYIAKLRRSFFLFDSLGIALFTILGTQKGLDANLSVLISILMGVVSATFGGVIRDVLANKVPLIFRKEIYATACFAGGVSFILLSKVIPWESLTMIICALIVLLIRYLSVKHKWGIYVRPIN